LESSTKARFLNGFFYRKDWRTAWTTQLKKEMEDPNYLDENGEDSEPISGGKLSIRAYSYLYGAMIANLGNTSHVIAMRQTSEDPYQVGSNLFYDPASGATEKLAPVFGDMRVEGDSANLGKTHYAGELRTGSTKADITALCRKAEFHDNLPNMKPGSEAIFNYDMMYFVDGKVVLRDVENDILQFINHPSVVATCVSQLTKLQAKWFH
jgi:hypothetical protein